MSAVTMHLASQIFDPKNRSTEGRILSTSDGIVQTLTIYTWPKNITDDEKLTFLSYLTAFGRSEDESPSRWATWMYSYLVLCFEPMADLIRRQGGREYRFEPLSVSLIKEINRLSEMALNFDGSGDNKDYSTSVSSIVMPPKFPILPKTEEFFPDVLAAGCIVEAVYGYASLLIFLAGKRITEKNSITISERRPQNLVDTYSINEMAAFALTGDGKMNSVAHHMCNQAWVTYAHARIAIITDVASFSSGATLAQRVVFTVSKMIENTGMQPAYYIHRFLQAFPQCMDYACIRPALGVYAASIQEVSQVDSRIQPYYKVIHGDLTRAFHRNGLLTLAAVAISYEKLTSPSMKNFALGEGATAAVNMFDVEAASKGHQTLASVMSVNNEVEAGLE